jgi:DinB superfamily
MELIDQLERTKSETLKYFDLSESDLQKKYGPDKWSVRYVLHHLADSESVLLYRLRRVISEPRQVIWFYDQEAWATKLDYSTLPLELSKNLYSISRDAIIYYARHHYEGSNQINFVHSTAGLCTLKSEFDKVVSHNHQHLSSIQKALS